MVRLAVGSRELRGLSILGCVIDMHLRLPKHWWVEMLPCLPQHRGWNEVAPWNPIEWKEMNLEAVSLHQNLWTESYECVRARSSLSCPLLPWFVDFPTPWMVSTDAKPNEKCQRRNYFEHFDGLTVSIPRILIATTRLAYWQARKIK